MSLKQYFNKFFICLFFIQMTSPSAFSREGVASRIQKEEGGGAIAGGGGDAHEMQFDIIRSDLATWINNGGADYLKLEHISNSEYKKRMSAILSPSEVLVNFISSDDQKNPERQTIVNGKEKTCKGFIGRDNNSYIVCKIDRFANLNLAEKYRLVHHEYAGLVLAERNKADYSDYHISNQIVSYLEQTSLYSTQLGIKNPNTFRPMILTKTDKSNEKEFKSLVNLIKTNNVISEIINTKYDGKKLEQYFTLTGLDSQTNLTCQLKVTLNKDSNNVLYQLDIVSGAETISYNMYSYNEKYSMNLYDGARYPIKHHDHKSSFKLETNKMSVNKQYDFKLTNKFGVTVDKGRELAGIEFFIENNLIHATYSKDEQTQVTCYFQQF